MRLLLSDTVHCIRILHRFFQNLFSSNLHFISLQTINTCKWILELISWNICKNLLKKLLFNRNKWIFQLEKIVHFYAHSERKICTEPNDGLFLFRFFHTNTHNHCAQTHPRFAPTASFYYVHLCESDVCVSVNVILLLLSLEWCCTNTCIVDSHLRCCYGWWRCFLTSFRTCAPAKNFPVTAFHSVNKFYL